MIDVRNGKREKSNWKGPLLLFILLTAISAVVNSYLSLSFNLPFFQNRFSIITGLIVVGVLWGIKAIINVVATIISRRKNLSKALHNPKVVWIISGAIGGALLIFLLWFMPIGQKIAYTVNLNNAVSEMEDSSETEDISLVQVLSEDDCLRRRGCDHEYNNVFYVRNNLDQPKEIQVKIRALNDNKEVLRIIDSQIVELEPGDMQMITTEETNDSANIWGSILLYN